MSLPSLLMQAARTAALADGLVPSAAADNPVSASTSASTSVPPPASPLAAAAIVRSATSSAAASATSSSASSSAMNQPNNKPTKSTVEAALAMVAVGNSKPVTFEDANNKSNPAASNTATSSSNSNRNSNNNNNTNSNNSNSIQTLGRHMQMQNDPTPKPIVAPAPAPTSASTSTSSGTSSMPRPRQSIPQSSASTGAAAVGALNQQQKHQLRNASLNANTPTNNNNTNSSNSSKNSNRNNSNISNRIQPPKSAGSAAHMLAVAAATHGGHSSNPNANTNSNSLANNNNNNNNSKLNNNPNGTTKLVPSNTNANANATTTTNTNNNTTSRPRPVSTSTSKSTSISMVQKPTTLAPPTAPQSSSTSPAPRSSSTSSGAKKKGPPLRRGKWTPEEEAYANRLIVEFKAGLLPLTDGTTLRTFLSKLLNCDPMRISKKFVGSNCIGKQVFRRRTADINRLTQDQIQQSRAELSELERRFLERVAQTNRVKSSGVGNNTSNGNSQTTASVAEVSKVKQDDIDRSSPPSPPWLRPPNGFKHGTGAATAANGLSSGAVNRTALIGRALLRGNSSMKKTSSKPSLSSSGSAGLLALMELQRRQSNQNLLAQSLGNSTSNLLAAAAAQNNGSENSLSGPAMAQIARNASAARMAGLAASGNSMSNLMMKTGLSRDQLSQLVKERSSSSLSNMMGRQSSLDALMSLDFQSLQSIDNLANLIQTGANTGPRVPKSGMKNWSSEGNTSGNSLAAVAASLHNNSNNNVSQLVNLRRLASEGRMESLIRSLSSGNVANKGNNSGGSNANFNDILQSMQNNLNGDGRSTSNLFGQAASALNLANMLRTNSSTGLTALRMQDGLAQRNTSVDDFLSLVASGDIPHQDPHMLNVPLQTVLQQQQQNQNSGASAAAQYLAHQQLLAQAANNGNSSLSQRIASLGGITGNSSAASLLSQYQQHQRGSNNGDSVTAGLFAQQHQVRALAAAAQQHNTANALETLKRKFSLSDMVKDSESQGPSKR